MPDEAGYIASAAWSRTDRQSTDNATMQDETDDLHELAEQFDFNTDRFDPNNIDPKLVRVMRYIRDNTGLLGDYNEGRVFLGEGGRIIQWYGRGRYLSGHDDLLHWVQCEAPGVHLATVGHRPHPDTGETATYAEIHLSENWGYDE